MRSRLFQRSHRKPLPGDAEIVQHEGKPHVRVRVATGNTRKKVEKLCPLTPDGRGYWVKGGPWWGSWRGADGEPVEESLSTNRDAAQLLLNQRIAAAEMARAGKKPDPREAQSRRPLADHLADFGAAIRDGDSSDKHARQFERSAARVFRDAGFVTHGDITESGVLAALSRLATDAAPLPPLPPGGGPFVKAEAARLAGSTPASLPSLLKRHGLAGVGNGRARRYPLEVVEALRRRRPEGKGARTIEMHAAACRAFCRWMVRDRRAASDPLAGLRGKSVEADRMRRRPLRRAELARLLSAAATSTTTFRDLDGPTRAVLYRVAAGTGLRASELASLTPASFDLGPTPAVSLRAAAAKNGKAAVLPLSAELAGLLREFLATRPANAAVWPGHWPEDAAEMVRADLAAAGVPFVVEWHDGPRRADFHALRHTFGRMLKDAGVPLDVAMQLMRHSDPKLTAATYGRAPLTDLATAVNRLPVVAGFTADLPSPAVSGGTAVDSGPVAGTPVRSRTPGPEMTQPAFVGRVGTDVDPSGPGLTSAPSRARTEDPLIKSQLLYRLS